MKKILLFTSLAALFITGSAYAQTVTNLTGVTQIEMYGSKGAFALKNGGLYHFGANTFRDGEKRVVDGYATDGSDYAAFIPPEFQSGLLDFSIGTPGSGLAAGIKEGGRLVIWEDVACLQTGEFAYNLPRPFPTDWESGVTDVACDNSWFYYIKDGAVHYVGDASPGAIGSPHNLPPETQSNMVSVETDRRGNYCGLNSSGGAVIWGLHKDPSAVPAHLQSGCTDIDAAAYVAVVKDGAVHLFSNPPSEVASVPLEAQSGVVQVEIGDGIILARKTDGRVIGWGDNIYFCHQPPAAAQNAIYIETHGLASMAVRADGEIVVWGVSHFFSPISPEIHSRVLDVAAGHHHSLALTSWGKLFAWGNNNHGQTDVPIGVEWRVPIGTIRHSTIFSGKTRFGIYPTLPVIAGGGSHSLGIDTSGRVRSWGALDQSTVPATATNCVAVDAGTDFSMALTADGQVLSWGSIPQEEVPAAATNCVMIAAGYTHALALTADHTVLGWGDGSGGKLDGISELSNIHFIGAGEQGSIFVDSCVWHHRCRDKF